MKQFIVYGITDVLLFQKKTVLLEESSGEDISEPEEINQSENVTKIVVCDSVVARTLGRYGISESAGSTIVSVTLQDIGLINKEDYPNDSGSSDASKVIREEHITLLKEPGSFYIRHVSLNSGTALSIERSSEIFFQQSLIDSKKNNCSWWFICLLHTNELSLRYLFEHLDGSTSRPRVFAGPIGKAISLGEFSTSLVKRSPDKLVPSRWLTTANRI
nr:unnamed protein product [Callosobruchus analis]